MRNLITSVFLGIAMAFCMGVSAMADTTSFSDLGSGDTYSCCSGGYAVSGTSSAFLNGEYVSTAAGFTASVSGTLSQIDLGLGYISGTNAAIVSIYTDTGSGLGSLIFSGTVSGQPTYKSTGTVLTTLLPTSGALIAGDNYFMVVSPGAGDTYDGWNFNDIGLSGELFYDKGVGYRDNGIQPVAAFDVKVNNSAEFINSESTAVPEPSSWLMLGAEIICLMGVVSWRRFAFANFVR